jgi:hypothetical protein
LARVDLGGAVLEGHAALGFAELQVGEDTAGFSFGSAGPLGTETAGAEAGASLRLMAPIYGGVDFIGELGASAAWMPHAPELFRPLPRWQPGLSLTVGAGF